MIHQPFLIAFALAVDSLALAVEVNFLILAPVLVVTYFAVAWLLVARLRVASKIL